MGALITALYNVNIDSKKTRAYRPFNYIMGRENERSDFILAYRQNEEKQVNSRKPMTSVSEWKKTLEMAQILSHAYEVKS